MDLTTLSPKAIFTTPRLITDSAQLPATRPARRQRRCRRPQTPVPPAANIP